MKVMRAVLVASLLLALPSCGTEEEERVLPPGYSIDPSAPRLCFMVKDAVYDADAKQIARVLWGIIPENSVPKFSRPGTYYISAPNKNGTRDGLLIYEDGTGRYVHSVTPEDSNGPGPRSRCVEVSSVTMEGRAGAWTAMLGAVYSESRLRANMSGEDIELHWGPIDPPEAMKHNSHTVLLVRKPSD